MIKKLARTTCYVTITEMVTHTGKPRYHESVVQVHSRSPWSNQYDPPLADGTCTYPSEKLRKMEIEANDIFDTYREM